MNASEIRRDVETKKTVLKQSSNRGSERFKRNSFTNHRSTQNMWSCIDSRKGHIQLYWQPSVRHIH